MIAISHCPKSRYYSEICLDAWNKLGYTVNLFEAVTPNLLYNEFPNALEGELKFYKRKGTKSKNPFTPTELAIWYSHYRLWQYAAQQKTPTLILEHDTYPFKPLVDFSDKPLIIFSQFPSYEGAWTGIEEILSPGSGYYLTPMTAKLMCEYATSVRHRYNVDAFILEAAKIANNLVTHNETHDYMSPYISCFQLYNEEVGTSAIHNED